MFLFNLSLSLSLQRIHLIHRDTTPSFFKVVMKISGIEMELIGDDERTVWKEIVPTGRRICQS